MTRSARQFVLVCFVWLFSCSPFFGSPAFALDEETVIIDVDASAPGTPLSPVWAFFGYDEANYTTLPEARELLHALTSAHAVPVHIRTHFLFNSGNGMPALKWGSTNVYTEGANANPIYDFAIIDGIMDATINAGAVPLFEIGFMPQALSTRPDPYENSNPYLLDGGSFYPPNDYEKWAALIRTWAKHVKERYPNAETSWLWELWNEPDIGYWRGTFEEYIRLFDHTEAALHEVLPDAPLGGPAVARVDGTFLPQFLEHCSSGTNAVTGDTGTRLDLVTFHAKGGVTLADGVQMNLGEQLSLHRTGFETVAASDFRSVPIIISEADPDGCAACPSTTALHLDYRNSPAYGAYEVAMMKRSLDLAAEVDVDLRGVLTWAFTFPEMPYFSGHRTLATNGIHLPVFNAFKLLARLSGHRIPVRSSGALPLHEVVDGAFREHSDVDALAALDGNEIRILVFHYHDDLVPADHATVSLTIKLPVGFEEGARVMHQRVDETHGNAFTVWRAQGSPRDPSDAELMELRRSMDLMEFEPEHVIDVKSGEANLSFELPRFGVSLLSLVPFGASDTQSSKAAGSDSGQSGCSCRTAAGMGTRLHPLLPILLLVALIRRRSTPRRPTIDAPRTQETRLSQC